MDMPQNETILTLVRQQLKKEDSFPVLSPEAIKIQTEATKKDPHFSVIAGLIRKDPTLTSQVLKTANSPFYRGVKDADTLKDALTRLGQNEMVNVIMKVMHQQNFRSENPLIRSCQEKLWHHSVNCAIGSLWTARYLSLGDIIPKAFIAGLLHDMGKLYILTALEKIIDSRENVPTPGPEQIEEILDKFHPESGYNLLTKWNLPEQYQTIARDHHADEYDSSDRLLLIVRIVNALEDQLEKNGQQTDTSLIFSSREASILQIDETCAAELRITLENARALI
jgi:HD-like signal output (HDOD) protein